MLPDKLRRLSIRIGLDTSRMDDDDLKHFADFMASQVSSLSDEDVAYAAYVGMAVTGSRQPIISKLLPKLLKEYKKRLVGWFEHALINRANVGGGGVGIKKVEHGLESWVKVIPSVLLGRAKPGLEYYIPENDYLIADRLNPVANKVLLTVWADAEREGFRLSRPKRASLNLPVDWVPRHEVFVIPSDEDTFPHRKVLRDLGFDWNRRTKTWYTRELNDRARRELRVRSDRPDLSESLSEWYYHKWLPANIGRFTYVFTEYAKNKQTSYQMVFKVTGTKVTVKFKRGISTAAEAVEELRYRYTGRHGREPWLEVMDKFIELVGTDSYARLPAIIDRINNLQHSNGLFMDHFPASVKSWYGYFLNAKYHTPHADELAKFIDDRDLKDILMAVAHTGLRSRPQDWRFIPPPDYGRMTKQLEDTGDEINWRKRGYPKYKGYQQVDRFDSEIQQGLRTLRKLDSQRERILNTDVPDEGAYKKVMGDFLEYAKNHQKVVDDIKRRLERQRQREIRKPGAADVWMRINFPEEFVEKYPWAAKPGSLTEFLPRYS